jgi:hypothetical protein
MRSIVLLFVMKDLSNVTPTSAITQGLVFGDLEWPNFIRVASRFFGPRLGGAFYEFGRVLVAGLQMLVGSTDGKTAVTQKPFMPRVPKGHQNRSSVIHSFSEKTREVYSESKTVIPLFYEKGKRCIQGASLGATGCTSDGRQLGVRAS